MTPLSHSAAHEQLADLALEPAALRRLARDLDGPGHSGDLGPLAAHIATCATCRAEIADWERVHGTVSEALSEGEGHGAVRLTELARDEPVRAPATLRAAVGAMATGGGPAAEGPAAPDERPAPVREVEVAPPESLAAARSSARPSIAARILPLVAVLAVVLAAGGLLVNQSRQLDRATADAAALAAVTATLDRVILDPGHRAIELRAADGSAGGSVVWSSHDLVVLTTALSAPPDDVVYRCWIERDGHRSPIGRMFFANGTGYWTGSLDAWATTSLSTDGTFGISLEPVGGSTGSPAVLVAQLGS
jgi:hypothetical protein